MPIESYREVALLLLVSIAAMNDLMTRRIPNRLLLAGLAGALVLHLLSAHPAQAVLAALGGMGAGFALFLPFYLLRGMAAGDVKMMAVVGAFTGPREALEIAVLAWCIGGAMALALVVLRGRLGLALGNVRSMLSGSGMSDQVEGIAAGRQSAGSMPYGLAIALGTIIVLLRHYG